MYKKIGAAVAVLLAGTLLIAVQPAATAAKPEAGSSVTTYVYPKKLTSERRSWTWNRVPAFYSASARTLHLSGPGSFSATVKVPRPKKERHFDGWFVNGAGQIVERWKTILIVSDTIIPAKTMNRLVETQYRMAAKNNKGRVLATGTLMTPQDWVGGANSPTPFCHKRVNVFIPEPGLRSAFRDAWSEYESVVNVPMVEVSRESHANITVRVADLRTGIAGTSEGGFGMGAGLIKISRSWFQSDQTELPPKVLLMHELGHNFGMGHSDVPGSIMKQAERYLTGSLDDATRRGVLALNPPCSWPAR